MEGIWPDESPGHKNVRNDIQGQDSDSEDENEAKPNLLGHRKNKSDAASIRERKVSVAAIICERQGIQ